MNINTVISVGEFFDKITILEIKKEKITDDKKLINVNYELTELRKIEKDYNLKKFELSSLIESLYAINLELWNIEDQIRLSEQSNNFGSEFIELARSVYIKNDLRAKIKKDINLKSGSNLIEEKSYQEY
tara:strand:- start:414 stop:800 length:387 start_codon:yes stop_codon:yes gene_type:complete